MIKEIYFEDRKSLHEWLAQNHHKENAIWLVYDKSSQGGKLRYEDIVEEALCFGWIDSTVRARADNRSMVYLAVRKPKSIWASSNKDRVERLTKLNLMKPAGLKAVEIAKENGSWSSLDDVENLVIPNELAKEFAKNKKAEKFFSSLTLSMRKQILYSIYNVKQAETRQRRVEKIMASLRENKKPF